MMIVMDEKQLEKEIENLLSEAENYLMQAKAKKGKDVQNFEGMLAYEYAIKAKNKSVTLRHKEEFYENVGRRVQRIFDELKQLPLTLQRQKSEEERKYEEGDVAGG
jgi:hypothetical protein